MYALAGAGIYIFLYKRARTFKILEVVPTSEFFKCARAPYILIYKRNNNIRKTEKRNICDFRNFFFTLK